MLASKYIVLIQWARQGALGRARDGLGQKCSNNISVYFGASSASATRVLVVADGTAISKLPRYKKKLLSLL